MEGSAEKAIETTEFMGVGDDILELGAGIEKVIDRATIITCLVGIMREKFVDVEDSIIVIKDLAKVERGIHLTDRGGRSILRGRFERGGARFQVGRKRLRGEVGNLLPVE